MLIVLSDLAPDQEQLRSAAVSRSCWDARGTAAHTGSALGQARNEPCDADEQQQQLLAVRHELRAGGHEPPHTWAVCEFSPSFLSHERGGVKSF